MILVESKIKILDNSGARIVKCIKILNNKFPGSVTDYVIVAVQRYNKKKKIRAGEIYLGIIVKTKFKFYRKTGQFLKAYSNGIVLLKKDQFLPLGNRLNMGFLFLEIRQKGLTKLISLGKDIR